MKDINLRDGLNILLKYRKPGYWLDAQHDELWLGNTEVPLDEKDFNDMLNYGFDLDGCSIENEDNEYPTYSDYLNDENVSGWHCYT